MAKLNQVLADRTQSFSEAEKQQARDNIGAASVAEAGMKDVSHDSSLTGNGNTTQLGVSNYDGLATKDWVASQGYITAQGSELTAGRGVKIENHIISTPSACDIIYPLKVSDTLTVDRPVTSLKEYRYKGAVNAFQQTLIDGPSDTLYVFNAVPQLDGVWGLDKNGSWQECLTGMPLNIECESVTTKASGPDFEATATQGLGGFNVVEHGVDEDGNEYTSRAGITPFDVWVRHDDNSFYSLTAGDSTDATLTGNGKSTPLGLAEDIDHRGVMKYVNASLYNNGLGITGGNVRSTALYTSTQPMSGQYFLSWGAKGHSTNMWGNAFFVRVSVGPDWGKADSQGNYAFGGYDWYTRAGQNMGANTCEIMGGSQMVYLTGQTSINISMSFCSAWGELGTPSYVNGSWAGMAEFHTGHWLSDVWVTLDKVGPFAGPRTNKYR